MIHLSNARVLLQDTGKFTDKEVNTLIKELHTELSPRLAKVARDTGASWVLADFFDIKDWTDPNDPRPDVNDY